MSRKIATTGGAPFRSPFPVTPGPWWLEEGNCGAIIGVMSASGSVCLLGRTEAVNPADAQSILSVPEMITALERIEAAFLSMPVVEDLDDPRDRITYLMDVPEGWRRPIFLTAEDVRAVVHALQHQRGERENLPPDSDAPQPTPGGSHVIH